MEKPYIEDQQFEKIDFSEKALAEGDYEGCSFINCNFSNADLARLNFTDCQFTGCNLSLTKLSKTTFNDVAFKDCKLLGLHFDTCNEFLFTVDFDNCNLDMCSFYKRKMKNTCFKNSSLQEVDFTEADLTGATFHNCNLARAAFENTLLEKADFRSAYNYSIDPEINRVKKARFSTAGIAGLLHKYDIKID